MKVFKRSKAYGAFEYAVIIALVIVAALIILKIVKGKTNPTFLDTSKAAVDNYIAESTTKIEESVPDTSGIVVDFSEFRYTTTSAENVSADILAALKASNIAKDKDSLDISDSLEIVQGADTLHGVGKRTIKLRATDKDSNTKEFFKTIILTQTINDDFLSNYLKAVITNMGVEFSSEEDFNAFVIDFFNDEIEGEPIKDILKAELLDQIEKAEINKDINTLQEGSEPRQIAIPVPDSLIDNLFNKLKDLIKDEQTPEMSAMFSDFNSRISSNSYEGTYRLYKDNLTNCFVFLAPYKDHYLYDSGTYVFSNIIPGRYGTRTWRYLVASYSSTNYNFINGTISEGYNITNDISLIYDSANTIPSFEIILPTGNFNLNWTSPYTEMRTVTIPIPSQSSANKISTYTEPSKFIYKTH